MSKSSLPIEKDLCGFSEDTIVRVAFLDNNGTVFSTHTDMTDDFMVRRGGGSKRKDKLKAKYKKLLDSAASYSVSAA